MNTDIEQLLAQELRQVARDVHVPAMPSVTETAKRPSHRWIPFLVAAVIATIVAGAMLLVPEGRGNREAPPLETPRGLSTQRPTVPYVEDRVLRDGDVVVPGRWKFVIARGDTWAALREDGTWWWDLQQGEPEKLEDIEGEPVLSANGKFMATIRRLNGDRVVVTVAETRFGGEGLGGHNFNSGGPDDEHSVQLVGVTDSGLAILNSVAWNAPRIWDPFENRVVDTAGTLDKVFAYNTPGGLVWMDEDGGNAILGELDAQGRVTSGTSLPHAQVVPNPDATYGFAEGKLGDFGDESVIETMTVHDLVKTGSRTVVPPEGWHFLGGGFQWEDATRFLAWVVGDGDEQRTARCSVTENRCVLVDPAA